MIRRVLLAVALVVLLITLLMLVAQWAATSGLLSRMMDPLAR